MFFSTKAFNQVIHGVHVYPGMYEVLIYVYILQNIDSWITSTVTDSVTGAFNMKPTFHLSSREVIHVTEATQDEVEGEGQRKTSGRSSDGDYGGP